MKAFVLLLLMILCSFAAAEQKKGDKEKKPETPYFKVPVNIVTIRATVKDKQGNPVADLNQNDFKIYEDGKLQEINSFARETFPLSREPAQDPKNATASAKSSPSLKPPVYLTRHRMISLIIDDLMLDSLENLPRLIQAVQEYVIHDVAPFDQIAILSGSAQIQVPFTDDKQILQERIAGILGAIQRNVPAKQCPDLTDQQAYRIAFLHEKLELNKAAVKALVCMGLYDSDDFSDLSNGGVSRGAAFAGNLMSAGSMATSVANMQYEQNESRIRILLDTLRKHLRALKHFDAEKRVIFFSSGFLSESSSYTAHHLQEVIDRALNSRVVFNCVNIRGLETGLSATDARGEGPATEMTTKKINGIWNEISNVSAEGGDLSQWNEISKVLQHVDYIPVGNTVSERLDDFNAKENPLKQLADDTGGQFFTNNNNLYKGIRQIIHSQSSDYILTYATSSQKPDGVYHRIKLDVSRPGLEISYRKGFYSSKEEMTFEKRKKEDIMDALQAPGNLNEIPVSLSYNCYREDASIYGVSFLTSMDIDKLHFLDEDARRKNLISLVLAAYDENDQYIDGVEKTIDFKLLERSYSDLRRRGLSSRVELKLPLGRYRIKAVVRESVQGKMGSLSKTVEIP